MKDNILIGIEWEPQLALLEYPNLPVNFKTTELPESYISMEVTHIDVCINSNVFDQYAIGPFPYVHNFVSTDMVKQNLEVRTYPTTPDKLPSQILLCNKHMSNFITELKQLTNNGVGVFLPKAILAESDCLGFIDNQDVYRLLKCSTPSKHVSISFRDNSFSSRVGYSLLSIMYELGNYLYKSKEYNSLKSFRTFIKTRFSTVSLGIRLHITVPYNFTEYEKLIPLAEKLWESDNSNWFEYYMDLAHYLDNWYKENEPSGPKLIGCIKNNNYINIGGLM